MYYRALRNKAACCFHLHFDCKILRSCLSDSNRNINIANRVLYLQNPANFPRMNLAQIK